MHPRWPRTAREGVSPPTRPPNYPQNTCSVIARSHHEGEPLTTSPNRSPADRSGTEILLLARVSLPFPQPRTRSGPRYDPPDDHGAEARCLRLFRSVERLAAVELSVNQELPAAMSCQARLRASKAGQISAR